METRNNLGKSDFSGAPLGEHIPAALCNDEGHNVLGLDKGRDACRISRVGFVFGKNGFDGADVPSAMSLVIRLLFWQM